MIASAQALWWLALPLLLLPIWWHRQKRQRVKSEPLATARFLPAAPPQTARVWRWEDLVLLALRCLLLAALLAWLAATSMPWRGDTVFIDPALTEAKAGQSWSEQQIAAAGLSGAARKPLPADALHWLQANEHEWRPGARMLILAANVPMPAQLPPLAHAIEIRLPPKAAPAESAESGRSAESAAAAQTEHHIVLSAPPERIAAWRALFAAFESVGAGRYVIDAAPGKATELIVWDSPAAPPANWQAPLWWLSPSAPLSALGAHAPAAQPLSVNGIPLGIADSPRGRIWVSPSWPPQDADAASALYETWQTLARPAQPYPMPAMQLAPRRNSPLAMPTTPPATWLAYVLLALFALERLMTHVRRR